MAANLVGISDDGKPCVDLEKRAKNSGVWSPEDIV
jgi:hypothetical protein